MTTAAKVIDLVPHGEIDEALRAARVRIDLHIDQLINLSATLARCRSLLPANERKAFVHALRWIAAGGLALDENATDIALTAARALEERFVA